MATGTGVPVSRAQEAAKLYRTLFGGEPGAVLVDRFVLAAERLDGMTDPAELALYRRCVSRVGDLEALEVACRYTRRLPVLCRKLQLMVYLAETLPEHYDDFVNERSSPARGWAALFGGLLRTSWKLGYGLILLARVRHG
jgi:hypothetical protein